MSKLNSRAKGVRGELEWAAYLTELGFTAHRGRQYQGRPEAPDVLGGIPQTHCECKRVQALNVNKAMAQAVRDAGAAVPYVAHRRNHQPWLITLRADDLIRFAELIRKD